MKTLIIDGNNLFKIGLFGVKDYYYQGQHIGGLYHFINTLRKHLTDFNYDKIVVFWDGKDNDKLRKEIYPAYKENRRVRLITDDEEKSSDYQELRIKQYLEEFFVRQGEYNEVEADDAIAYYCFNAPGEEITIVSQDLDLTQLINEKVKVYLPRQTKFLTIEDKVDLDGILVPPCNVWLVKTLCGDDSDNVAGIKGMGVKTLIKNFPLITEQKVELDDLLASVRLGLKMQSSVSNKKPSKTIMNLIEGVSKHGTFGESFFEINKKIVDLSSPHLTEQAKFDILQIITVPLDPEDRGWKNILRMMKEDGMFNYLPKVNDGWIEYLHPLLQLARKEKKFFNNN